MSDIEIILKDPSDPTKSRSWHLSLPADVAVKHVLNALIPKLGLAIKQRDGHPIVYNLYHVQSDTIISDNETLMSAGIAHNDTCLLLRKQSTLSKAPKVHPGPKKTQITQKTHFNLEEPQEALPTGDIPSTLRYTDQHVWINIEMGVGRCGITDFLAQQILLILDVELPEEGQPVSSGKAVSTMWFLTESMDEFEIPLFSPVSGIIYEVNKKLKDRFLREAELELIQEDPYGRGWLFSIQLSGSSKPELERLMDAGTYQKFIRR
jgi:glycine cleavage system H protein